MLAYGVSPSRHFELINPLPICEKPYTIQVMHELPPDITELQEELRALSALEAEMAWELPAAKPNPFAGLIDAPRTGITPVSKPND